MQIKALILVMFCYSASMAQVAINDDGSSPDGSAMLDVQSSTKGILLPRLTTSERDDIANPAEGLLIYNKSFKTIEVFDGILWSSPVASFVCGNQIMDIDSNIYNTVLIGSQCWMKENLATTRLNDSVAIPNVTESSAWQVCATPAYCWWGNDSAANFSYGALYNFNSVNTGKLCPSGWHVPTDDEWKILELFIGMELAQTNLSGWRGTNEAPEIKNETGWNFSGNGNNNTGFSALPAGLRNTNGAFGGLGHYCYWWTSTAISGTETWDRGLYYDKGEIWRSNSWITLGMGIRCLKD